MKTVRVWFRKTGAARFLSHLDLSRCMARAIHRAKLPLWYTQGYNPHAFLTFALPLSLGITGERESMDIRLENDSVPREELIESLNAGLPDGISVFDASEPVMHPNEIAFASYTIRLETKDTESVTRRILGLFAAEEIIVPKHTKKGWKDWDLRPHLDRTEVTAKDGFAEIDTLLPAGSTLNVNPSLLNDAVRSYLGLDLYAEITRHGLYNSECKVFR